MEMITDMSPKPHLLNPSGPPDDVCSFLLRYYGFSKNEKMRQLRASVLEYIERRKRRGRNAADRLLLFSALEQAGYEQTRREPSA